MKFKIGDLVEVKVGYQNPDYHCAIVLEADIPASKYAIYKETHYLLLMQGEQRKIRKSVMTTLKENT